MPKTKENGLGLFARQFGETIFCGLRQLSIISYDGSISGTLYRCPSSGSCSRCPVSAVGKKHDISLEVGSDASLLVKAQQPISKAYGKLKQ